MHGSDIQAWMYRERLALAATRPHAHVYVSGVTGDSYLVTVPELARMWVDDACRKWYAERCR